MTQPAASTRTHDAIALRAGATHWVECTCGWLSARYRSQVGAVVEQAGHVGHAKATAR